MRWGAAVGTVLLVASGCSGRVVTAPRTEVLIEVTAEPEVRARTSLVRIIVEAGPTLGDLEVRYSDLLEPQWPLVIALVPEGGDAQRSFRVEVVAMEGTTEIVRARVVSGFVAERTKLLPLVLEDACIGPGSLTCGHLETCRDGTCADAVVDPTTLEDYEPPDAGPSNDAGGVDAGADAAVGCVPVACEGTVRQCGDCIDNDADGLIDHEDPGCLSPCDNDENVFPFSLAGQQQQGCVVDCAFDLNTGFADDMCMLDRQCDAEGEDYECWPDGSDCAEQSQTCRDNCLPITPNGCDCFGCCAVPDAYAPFVYIMKPDCAPDVIDPDSCPACTPRADCFNPCDACELCVGKLEQEQGCEPAARCPGGQACGAGIEERCPPGEYCFFGCCEPPPF
jgi:hypothetical protein